MSHKKDHGGTHFTSWAQELAKAGLREPTSAIAFSPDGAHVGVATAAGCRILATDDLRPLDATADGNAALAVRISHGGFAVVGRADGTAHVYSAGVRAPAPTLVLDGHAGPVVSVAISPGFAGARDQPERIATASADGTARVWQVARGACVGLLTGHTGPLSCVDFSADGTRIVTAAADGTARVWATPAASASGRDDPVACVAVLRGHAGALSVARFGAKRHASVVVTGSSDATARVWDLRAGGQGGQGYAGRQHTPSVAAGAAAPLDVAPASVLECGRTAGVVDLALGENAETLCTASADGSMRLWTLRDGKLARTLTAGGEAAAVAFSATKLVTATTKGTIKVWGIVPSGGRPRA